MLRFLRIVALAIVGAWSLLRGAEEAFAIWVRRASRPQDLSGVVEV